MKVLMLGRIDLLKNGGGDLVQIENTANELRNLGVQVDIKTSLNIDMSSYDIIHIFQLDWSFENYFYIKIAKLYKKPIVLSPIHHNINEVIKFDDKFVFDFRRISKVFFKKQFDRDSFKNFYRSIFDIKKLKPSILSVLIGLKNMHIYTLQNSDIILVQTKKELEDLKSTYDVEIPNYKIVVNGVSKNFNDSYKFYNYLKFKDYIICVGRIEPRKNQLSIIKAVNQFRIQNKLDIKLVFVGKFNFINHFEYTLRFKKLVYKYNWIHHINNVPYNLMPSYYHFAKVGISASWFETTGLTSLEALFCGTNAVASGVRAKEYLGDFASYCQPDNIDSIVKALNHEYFANRPKLSDKMKNSYTWENASKQTYLVYKELLGH